MDPVLLERVAQRAHDVLLPDDVGERPGAVTAVERDGGGRHGTVSLALGPGVPPGLRRAG